MLFHLTDQTAALISNRAQSSQRLSSSYSLEKSQTQHDFTLLCFPINNNVDASKHISNICRYIRHKIILAVIVILIHLIKMRLLCWSHNLKHAHASVIVFMLRFTSLKACIISRFGSLHLFRLFSVYYLHL